MTEGEDGMTYNEFDEAVDRLRREGRGSQMTDAQRRVLAAARLVLRSRHLADDDHWAGPTKAELAVFLAGLNHDKRRNLKLAAESVF